MSLPQVLALLIAVQRLVEMAHAGRNARRLLAEGGIEYGAGHFPFFVALHGAWLVAVFALVPPEAPVSWPLLAIYGLLQVGRAWVLVTLGRYWTTRVISVPGAPLVRRGPYRLMRHPNYLVLAGEIAVLPLAFGAWEIALVFSLANAALLTWRIRVEDAALAPRRQV